MKRAEAMLEAASKAICVAAGDDPEREGPWNTWWRESAYAEQARAALTAILPMLADDLAGVALGPYADPGYHSYFRMGAERASDAMKAHLASLAAAMKEEG